MLLPSLSLLPTSGKPARLLSWSQERLHSGHTTQQLQVLEADPSNRVRADIIGESRDAGTELCQCEKGIPLQFPPHFGLSDVCDFVVLKIQKRTF